MSWMRLLSHPCKKEYPVPNFECSHPNVLVVVLGYLLLVECSAKMSFVTMYKHWPAAVESFPTISIPHFMKGHGDRMGLIPLLSLQSPKHSKPYLISPKSDLISNRPDVRRANLILFAVTPIPPIRPKLEPGLGLNTFASYRGILFKIYIVGKSIKVVRRFSLPDVSKCELEEVAGVFRFPRVSCAAATVDEADLDPSIAELPQRPLLEKLAKELHRQMGLRLFNIDMIREHGTSDVFYVIDINYFPGNYGKMPEYEHIFTYFLLSLMQNNYKKRADA
ncbi:hypothetical protein UlMin_007287 [Ulmus minor]